MPKPRPLSAKGGILKKKTAKQARKKQLKKVTWTEDTVHIIEPRQKKSVSTQEDISFDAQTTWDETEEEDVFFDAQDFFADTDTESQLFFDALDVNEFDNKD